MLFILLIFGLRREGVTKRKDEGARGRSNLRMKYKFPNHFPILAKKILRLKKNISPILLTLLLGLVTISATAQSWSQKFNLGVTYSSLNEQSRLASVFNLLASNNNKNVNNLRLQLTFGMHFSLSKTANGQVVLHYSGYGQHINGDIFFRSFKVDTLLLPKEISVEFLLLKDNHLISTLNREISTDKGEIILQLPENVSLSELSVDMQVKQMVCTQKAYARFLQTAGLINHYYGYDKIMQEMSRLLMETSEANHPPAASFFLNYVALSRLRNYVKQHNFTVRLHLGQYDPLNFDKTFKALLRRQIRMTTLSQQMLQLNSSPDFPDKEKFTHAYVALSLKAVSLSNEHQPYVATSFNEYARVFAGNNEAAFVRQAAAYYDQNSKPGQATVPQEIYKYFIDVASLKIRQQSFVSALNFLSDAVYFENHFPGVKRIAQFDKCLIGARDGLAASYLKVAAVAAERNDNQLVSKYIQKASQSLKTYNNLIKPPAITPCYSQYAGEMLQMAETSLKQGYFHKARALLDTAYLACNKLPGIDSLRTTVCEKLLKHRLDISRKLLEQNHIIAARDTLLQIAKDYPGLCPYNSKLTQNKDVTETATAIFQQTISEGARLHNQSRNVQAIAYLNSATELQRTFSLTGPPQLDTLIAETTVPYILSIMEKANLEIWKKHFQKADSIFRLAQSLSLRYRVSENNEIKNTLDALSVKIKMAGCQWKQEKIARLFTQINQEVKAYQMAAAKSYFLKAKKLYAGAGSCHWDRSQMNGAFNTYENLFRFADEYHRLTLQLFEKGFAAVLPDFVKLEQQYQSGHLEKFDLPFTGLYQFIQSQHSESLVIKTVHYFIRNKNFTEALRYLQLSENPAKAKTEQKQIAREFVKTGILPQDTLFEEPELAVFARTYRKDFTAKAK